MSPSAYTSDLYEGNPISFEEFVWACARNFGALLPMRDGPLDAPIPDAFEPSTYYKEMEEKAIAEIAEILSLSDEELGARLEAERQRWQLKVDEYQKGVGLRRARYEAMVEKVVTWTPPTPDHEPLKEFMLQQLKESLDYDCAEGVFGEPPPTDPGAWRSERISKLASDVAYCRKQYAAEVQRTEARNQWLQQLRESLR